MASFSDVEPVSLGGTAIFRTLREEGEDLVGGYALVDVVALQDELGVTPLPFPDHGGPGTYFRFQACSETLWLLAIVHPGPDDPRDPRLQVARVRPELDAQARDLGPHVNMGWDELTWTCVGEELVVVRYGELWELR